MVNALLQLPV